MFHSLKDASYLSSPPSSFKPLLVQHSDIFYLLVPVTLFTPPVLSTSSSVFHNVLPILSSTFPSSHHPSLPSLLSHLRSCTTKVFRFPPPLPSPVIPHISSFSSPYSLSIIPFSSPRLFFHCPFFLSLTPIIPPQMG